MSVSPLEILELNKLLVKDFQTEEVIHSNAFDMYTIRTRLAALISILLDKDMNRLLTIFYRVDLREDKVRQIIAQAPVAEISIRLADLVIEREMEKVKTRIKYKDL